MSTPDPNLRMSNTEREAVVERLHSAVEEGRLELDEFAERSRRVYEAKTFADVEDLLTDLPRDSGALAVSNEPGAEAPELTLNHSYTKVKRQGAWTVPARITVKPKYGRTTLDCRHAVFTSRDVELDLELEYSSLELILPKGASAVDDLQLHGGRVHNDCHEEGEGPRFHLTGSVHFAPVKVRYERRFLWWRW